MVSRKAAKASKHAANLGKGNLFLGESGSRDIEEASLSSSSSKASAREATVSTVVSDEDIFAADETFFAGIHKSPKEAAFITDSELHSKMRRMNTPIEPTAATNTSKNWNKGMNLAATSEVVVPNTTATSVSKAQGANKAQSDGLGTEKQPTCLWSDLHLSHPLLKALAKLGFDYPTAVQREVIPQALQGKDILGAAETGSGKTAAFLLPIIERLLQSPVIRARNVLAERRNPLRGGVASKALILLPTRELALQCFHFLQDLTQQLPLTQTLIVGGMDLKEQEIALRQQPDVIVATPGRVLDLLLNSQSVHMELLEIVVFDEADRLLELGFKEDCEQIITHCNAGRQTMLFSATLSETVENLAAFALNKPTRVTVHPFQKVAQSLEQQFVYVSEEAFREAALLHLCDKLQNKKRVIIFFQTKKQAHRMAIIMKLRGMKLVELHGNLSQAQRLDSLNGFREGYSVFLVASELASRGLDIPLVEIVINYEVPLDATRYVHRVGRTARIGRKGCAITLFSSSEQLLLKRIVRQVSTSLNGKKHSITKKRITTSTLEAYKDEIGGLQERVSAHIQEELFEKEMRLAEMHLQKKENMEIHADEIKSRPPRRWYLTKSQKQNMREASHKQVHEADASAGNGFKIALMQNPKSISEVKSSNSANGKKVSKKQSAEKQMYETREREAKIQRATKTLRKRSIADGQTRNLPAKSLRITSHKSQLKRFSNADVSQSHQSVGRKQSVAKKRQKNYGNNTFKSKKRYKRR